MLELLLVRHGETDWNGEHRVQGALSDIWLNANGLRQADRLGLRLKDRQVVAIYSSPQVRALRTAEAIARHHATGVNVEPDLREIDAGEFEGKTVASLGRGLGKFLIVDETGELPRLPSGEGLSEVMARAWAAVDRAAAGRTSGSIVFVSHYFTLLSIVCAALDLPLTTLRRLRVAPASLTTVAVNPWGRTLVALNDTCHLEAVARV